MERLFAPLLLLSLFLQDQGEPAKDPYDHLMLGNRAFEAGRNKEASEHYAMALAHRPGSLEILEKLLETSASDADARALWSMAWYAAAADGEGRAKPDPRIKGLLSPEDPHPAKVARSRVRAVKELEDFADDRAQRGKKWPGEYLVAQWARRLAVELSGPSPSLEEAAGRLDPGLSLPARFHLPVVKALEQVMNGALANMRTGVAMRAARCLRGLGAQANFKDLKGPRPEGVDRMLQEGLKGLRRARGQLERQVGEPWTVEQLEWLTREEGEAFTREHSSFANPGVALSPNGLYRVETDCGYNTLLGVARTVEDHHRRLAIWFGKDPFEGRRGIIRIVPESHGLESEGANYWWVGGFQGGDVTVLKFSCGTIEDLGHGLTHELTHRFDGAVYPGLPGWLLEGRAVWTGAAFGSSGDKHFVENHALFGTVQTALRKGYGGLRKLTELIEGEIEDYRDNYTAGYALYLYLNTWEEEGEKLYADRLEPFMRGASGHRKKRKEWFVKMFADGKDGRPKGLEEFAQTFHTFIQGFYWKTRQPWTERYEKKVPRPDKDPIVFDEPTWIWSRSRAEPHFGQDQAREAGFLLLEEGRRKEGIRSLVWALAVDGRSPRVERVLAEAFQEEREKDPAWILARLEDFPCEGGGKGAPFRHSLKYTKQLLELLEDAAAFYQSRGLAAAAASMRGERNRLASWLGLPFVHSENIVSREAELLHPFDAPSFHPGVMGWEEDELFGYEEYRRPNLWFVTEGGDLHVGRRKPRKATGLLDRRAHEAHAFARSKVWLFPGSYRISMRIKLTTSYAAGAVIFGYTRRDYNLRFQFNMGNFMVAIGESDEEPKFQSFNWKLHGRRVRCGPLAGSNPGGTFELKRPVPAFNLELLVDGAAVEAFINGEWVGAYHTVDGAPVEGYLGFATSFGAICAQQPMVERLDRSRLAGVDDLPLALDLSRAKSRPFEHLVNLPCRGLPASSNGTFLVWIPSPWLSEGEEFDPDFIVQRAHLAVEKMSEVMGRKRFPQPFFVALPEITGKEKIEELRKAVQHIDPAPGVVTHAFPSWISDEDPQAPDECKRWCLFIDHLNVIRVVMPWFNVAYPADATEKLWRWGSAFRDHGRPERDLPAFERRVEEEERE